MTDSSSALSGMPSFVSMKTVFSTERPSDRKFGFTFAAMFIAVGIYGLFAPWRPMVPGLCALAGASLFVLAATAPRLLEPLNRAWFVFGEILGRVVSPIALGFIFFVLITPVSVVTRLFGRDELRLKRRAVPSYWVLRQSSVPDPNSFKQQF
jgi:hypothetical protein